MPAEVGRAVQASAQWISSAVNGRPVNCCWMKPETRSFYEQAVQRAIEHIAGNLDEALDLETLAAGACLSAFHFHRVFRGMVGETPLELIRRLRIERAAWRLIKRDQRITEIAFDADTRLTRVSRAHSAPATAHPPLASGIEKHPRIELAATCSVHFNSGGVVPAFYPPGTQEDKP